MTRGDSHTMRWREGYTIVETLIFLAVSGLMFFAVIALLNGQQNKTQFVNAVRNFETVAQDIANDVGTGYFSRPAELSCGEVSGAPAPSGSPSDLGTQEACVLVGRIIEPSPDGESLLVYSVAGLRSATTLETAQAVKIDESEQRIDIGFGTRLQSVTYPADPDPSKEADGVAFLSSYTASQSAVVVPTENGPTGPDFLLDARQAVTFCIVSGTTSQYALIRMGGQGANGLTAVTEIKNYSGTPSCD